MQRIETTLTIMCAGYAFHMILRMWFLIVVICSRRMLLNLYLKSLEQLYFMIAPFCVLGGILTFIAFYWNEAFLLYSLSIVANGTFLS